MTDIRAQFIICKLLTTDFKGTTVWVAKIISDPTSNGKKNSNYSRFQFPLRLAYSMSINKVSFKLYPFNCTYLQAQGQTFERVGIVLKNNVFAHGQLYVALSRARDSNNVTLLFFVIVISDYRLKSVHLHILKKMAKKLLSLRIK